MLKKTAFITIAYCLKILGCNAQWLVGGEIGFTENYLHTNIDNLASAIINKNIGYNVAVPILYKISSRLYVKAVPNIVQKNYSINRTDSLNGIFTKYKNTYLQTAVMCHLEHGRRLQVFGDIGCYFGYWLSGTLTGKIPDIFSASAITNLPGGETFHLTPFNEKYVFSTRKDNRIEAGWIAGGGLQYQCTNAYSILLTSTYYQGLTDHQKKIMLHQVSQYNQSWIVSAGVLYALKQKHRESD